VIHSLTRALAERETGPVRAYRIGQQEPLPSSTLAGPSLLKGTAVG
jgi:hypothetical protein